MQTRTPFPVEPPQAHSRVISAGQSLSSEMSCGRARGQAPGRKLLMLSLRAQGFDGARDPPRCDEILLLLVQRERLRVRGDRLVLLPGSAEDVGELHEGVALEVQMSQSAIAANACRACSSASPSDPCDRSVGARAGGRC